MDHELIKICARTSNYLINYYLDKEKSIVIHEPLIYMDIGNFQIFYWFLVLTHLLSTRPIKSFEAMAGQLKKFCQKNK